jgi:hypothetical protein
VFNSPASRTERVAKFLDFTVMIDICPFQNAWSFRKNKTKSELHAKQPPCVYKDKKKGFKTPTLHPIGQKEHCAGELVFTDNRCVPEHHK